MNAKISFLILSMVLLFPFAHAQATNLQPLWDAINNLGASIQALQQDMQTVQSVGLQVVQDVQSRLISLESQVEQIQLIGAQVILDINANMISLQQRDENLQAQINTLSPNSPIPIARNKIYEVVNFDANANTAYCNDLDDVLLFGYCAGSLIGFVPNIPVLFFDNFDDLDYTNNPTWTVVSGLWFINNYAPNAGRLAMGSTGSETLLSTPSLINSIPLSMEMKVLSNVVTSQQRIALSDSSTTISNGYYFRLYSNGTASFIDLWRSNNGIGTLLITGSGFDINPGNVYTIKATRSAAGFWQMYFNNSPVGPSVHDSTFSNFSHTFLGAYHISQTGVEFDDVSVSVPDLNQAPQSAIENLNNYSQPMGIRCLNNGSARVMCLQQP